MEFKNYVLSAKKISKYYGILATEVTAASVHVPASPWESYITTACPWPTWRPLLWRSTPLLGILPSLHSASCLPLLTSVSLSVPFPSHLCVHSLSASEGSRKFWWPEPDRDKCFITGSPWSSSDHQTWAATLEGHPLESISWGLIACASHQSPG